MQASSCTRHATNLLPAPCLDGLLCTCTCGRCCWVCSWEGQGLSALSTHTLPCQDEKATSARAAITTGGVLQALRASAIGRSQLAGMQWCHYTESAPLCPSYSILGLVVQAPFYDCLLSRFCCCLAVLRCSSSRAAVILKASVTDTCPRVHARINLTHSGHGFCAGWLIRRIIVVVV